MTMPARFVLAVYLLLSSAHSSQPTRATRETVPVVPGLEAVLANYDVVMFGETYGTVESPQFVGDAAFLALQHRRQVTVALEIPQEEDPLLQAYLSSRRSDFIDGPFWHSAYKDGRNSEAMRNLIVRLRQWRSRGLPIDLVTLDPLETPRPGQVYQPLSTGVSRDEAMAERLVASIERSPENLFLVLTGNLHQRLYRGTPRDPAFMPMGLLVASYAHRFAAGTRIASLDVHLYGGGEAWVCQGPAPSDCGQVTLTEKSNEALSGEIAPRGITLLPGKEASSASGWVYFTEPVHASAPAVH